MKENEQEGCICNTGRGNDSGSNTWKKIEGGQEEMSFK